MPGSRPRLLLILPTHAYQAEEFIAAASRLDVDLTVASELSSSLESHQPDKLMTLDIGDVSHAASQVRTFAEHYPIDAVFGVNDRTVVVAAAIARELGIEHLDHAAASLAHNKHRQRMALREAGVRVPDFSVHSIAAPAGSIVPYPRVIKPVCLSASRGVIRADNDDEFRSAVRRVTPIIADNTRSAVGANEDSYLVEAFVPGPEFALEGLVIAGDLCTLAIFDKPDPLEGPYFQETIYTTPSRFPESVQKELKDCAAGAISALGIDRGPVHVEMRHNEEGAWLIELAARPIGGKCGRVLEFEPDRSLEELLLSHAMGLDTGIPALKPGATGVMMLPAEVAGVLREVTGQGKALAVEHVTGVIISAHRGQTLTPLPEGAQYLGFVFARAPTPEEVEAALREADAALEIKIR